LISPVKKAVIDDTRLTPTKFYYYAKFTKNISL